MRVLPRLPVLCMSGGQSLILNYDKGQLAGRHGGDSTARPNVVTSVPSLVGFLYLSGIQVSLSAINLHPYAPWSEWKLTANMYCPSLTLPLGLTPYAHTMKISSHMFLFPTHKSPTFRNALKFHNSLLNNLLTHFHNPHLSTNQPIKNYPNSLLVSLINIT